MGQHDTHTMYSVMLAKHTLSHSHKKWGLCVKELSAIQNACILVMTFGVKSHMNSSASMRPH